MKYELWLASLTRISSEKRIRARALSKSARAFYEQSEKTDKSMHIFTPEEIEWIGNSRRNSDVDEQWDSFQKSGMSFVCRHDPGYPARLQNIYRPPYALFYRGGLPGDEKSVGIVGARMCSEYGRSIAGMLGRRLAACGVSVVSGMAIGIDSAAHAGALEAEGSTFAVLGCGCDICYPKSSWNLYQNMQKTGGVLSEYPPGTKPVPWHFPERNRIISALSDILVVVEARERSGSLITVDSALEQGRDVYAVPGRYGDELSRGCSRLIAQGAGILYDIDVFMEEEGILKKKTEKHEKSAQVSLEKEERLVYSCLDLHPKFINNIIEETGLHVLEAMHVLEGLKQKRMVQETFQNYYCRCI